MAQKVFAIQLVADVAKATKDFHIASKALAKIETHAASASKDTNIFSDAVFGLGASLIATAGTATMAGSVIERVMINADVALQRAGTSAMALNDAFIQASGAATSLYKASAQLAGAGVEGAGVLKTMSQDARLFGQAMGMSTEQAAVFMADFIRATGEKSPKAVRKWIATGALLQAQNRLSADTFKVLSHDILQSGINAKMTKESLLGLGVALQSANIQGGEAAAVMGSMVDVFRITQGQAPQLSALFSDNAKKMAVFKTALPQDKIQMFMESVKEFAGKGPGGLQRATEVIKGMNIAQGEAANHLAELAFRGAEYGKIQEEVTDLLADQVAQTKFLSDVENSLSNQLKLLWDDFKDVAFLIGQVLAPVAKLFVFALRGILGVIKMIPGPIMAVVVAGGALLGVWLLMVKIMSTKMIGSLIGLIRYLGLVVLSKMGDIGATSTLNAMETTGIALKLKTIALRKAELVAFLRMFAVKMKSLLLDKGLLVIRGASTAAIKANMLATGASTVAEAKLNLMKANGVRISFAATAALVKDTVAKIASKIATTALSIVTGIMNAVWVVTKGIFIVAKVVTWLLSAAMWGLASAVIAATWPVLLVIAAIALVVGIMVAAYYAITQGSTAMKAFGVMLLVVLGPIGWLMLAIMALVGYAEEIGEAFSGIGAGIMSVLEVIGQALYYMFIAPILLLIDLFTWLGGLIGSAFGVVYDVLGGIGGIIAGIGRGIRWITGLFKPLGDMLSWLGDMASGFVGWLFGSSMFHIKEGVHEISPSLAKLDDAFTAVGRAVGKVSDGTQLPDDVRVKIEEPLRAPAEAAPFGAPALAPAAQAAPAPMGGGAPTPKAIRVVVPVSVELDGMVLARAISEHVVEIENERHFNEPTSPLRGVGK